MTRRVVTKEDVLAAKGGVLEVGPDDLVTQAAHEAATRAAVAIVRGTPLPREAGEGKGGGHPEPSAWDSLAPGSASTSETPAAVVTAVGKNRPFVLAEITTKIGELNGDILDISQRIISSYFSTILIVDIGRVTTNFAGFKAALESLSHENDYKIVVQHERVFRAMHRI